MATIFWKTAAPFGTCRSRYKARRAAVVAARQRERRLLRRISDLLGQDAEMTLSQKMRVSAVAGGRCSGCGQPLAAEATCCVICAASADSAPDR